MTLSNTAKTLSNNNGSDSGGAPLTWLALSLMLGFLFYLGLLDVGSCITIPEIDASEWSEGPPANGLMVFMFMWLDNFLALGLVMALSAKKRWRALAVFRFAIRIFVLLVQIYLSISILFVGDATEGWRPFVMSITMAVGLVVLSTAEVIEAFSQGRRRRNIHGEVTEEGDSV